MKQFFSDKSEALFWVAAVALLTAAVGGTFFSVRFVGRAVGGAFSDDAAQAPLIIHFDFGTLNQVIEGKSIPLPAVGQ